MTDQIDAFTTVLQAHLQPLFDDFMNLEVWARICIGDLEGDDEHIREILAAQLPGFDVDWVTVDGTDFADTWTPKCCIVLCMELKGHDVRVEVYLTRAIITDITFGKQPMPKELKQIDLVKEFERKHLLLALSQ
jgi:hypothetical protein